MQASSLLLHPDRSFGELNLNSFSDQALMEMLIDGLKADSKKRFTNADGTYRDACKWKDVECNGRRHVMCITWKLEADDKPLLKGTLNLLSLPPRLDFIQIVNYASRHISGFIDASALPVNLNHLDIYGVTFDTSIDLRRLPPRLEGFGLSFGLLDGTCCLTALPQALIALDLSRNNLNGTIFLDYLPKNLIRLNLSDNCFDGEIYVHYLSDNLQDLFLQKNFLGGSFRLVRVPHSLIQINITDNLLTGPVVLSDLAIGFVDADFDKIDSLVDADGTPWTADDIKKRKKFADDARKGVI